MERKESIPKMVVGESKSSTYSKLREDPEQADSKRPNKPRKIKNKESNGTYKSWKSKSSTS